MSRTSSYLAALAAAFVVAVPIAAAEGQLTGTAVAAGQSYTPQAERALGERYRAMSEYYLGTSSSLPAAAIAALGERYQAMADFYARETSMPVAAVKALGARYEAMSHYYREAELARARKEANAAGRSAQRRG